MKRDLNLEKNSLRTFGDLYNREPDLNDPSDRARFYGLVYKSELPDELADNTDLSTFERITNQPGKYTTRSVSAEDLAGLGANRNAAMDKMNNLAGTQNEFMSALQNTIRTKEGFNKEKLGTSDLFGAAGISGVSTLISNLQQRNSEIEDKGAAFSNFIKDVKGLYGDMVTASTGAYDRANTLFQESLKEFQRAEDEAKETALTLVASGADIPESMRAILGDKFDMYKNVATEMKNALTRKAKQDQGLFDEDYSDGDGGSTPSERDYSVTLAQQNNNPLNIKVPSRESTWQMYRDAGLNPRDSGFGATDGGKFLAFDDPKQGFEAAKLLLKNAYSNLTLDQAMRRWSGNGYGADVAEELDPNLKIGSLTDTQLNLLLDGMALREGYYKIENGKFIDPGTYVPKTPAKTSKTDVPELSTDARSILNGTMKLDDIKSDLVRRKVAAEITKYKESQPEQMSQANQVTLNEINSALSNKEGLKAASGAWRAVMYGSDTWKAKKDFLGSVNEILSNKTLQKLIDAKAEGATFGALSEGELELLRSASSKLGTWGIIDKKTQKIKGFSAGEESVKKELERMRDLITKSGVSLDTTEQAGTSETPTAYTDADMNYVNSILNKK